MCSCIYSVYEDFTYSLLVITWLFATAITTHTSALLSGWIVQVTVMECAELVTLGLLTVTWVAVTEDAIGKYVHIIYYTHYIRLHSVL